MSDKKSLAVAYAMKKRSKKMAHGGIVEPEESALDGDMDLQASESGALEEQHKSENEDIVDAIMAKRRMASGGMILPAGETEDQFIAADRFSDHGQEANLKEDYASDLSDEDKDQSLVAQIMRDRKKKK